MTRSDRAAVSAATQNHSEQGHTQTPWRLSPHSARGDCDVIGTNNGWFMSLLTGAHEYKTDDLEKEIQAQFEVDSAFIVRCVNSHEALVKALEAFIPPDHIIEGMRQYLASDPSCGEGDYRRVINAKAALSLARNEQQNKKE
jgi:hypothetical protein